MATIRLIPSTYELSSTQYLSVSNASNMYANTDSTTYATITNTYASTSSRYLYLRGFNFGSIPSDAIINSFTVKIKGYESGLATSTSYAPRLANGTSVLSNTTATTNFGTSTNTITIPTGALTWQQIINYGSNFTIMIYVRRNNKNTTGYFYCYGAEIEVNYTIPVYHNITSTLATDTVSSINPSGVTSILEGEDYELSIYANSIDDFIVEDNGTDVTSSLVQHQVSSGGTTSTVLGEYTLESGSFNSSGATFFQGLVGKGESASTTTSNYYSSSSGTIAVFNYDLTFSNIPSNATITRLYVRVNGHAESTSQSNEYMCAQLVIGDTAISDELNFKSIGTSNSTQTIEATTLPTVEQLSNLKLKCRLGYYGGAINGATCYVEYTTPSSGYYWTYTLTNVQTDHTIIISDAIIEIPEEDPQYDYYPITISSINATTTPGRGTTRIIEGTNQTITIYPDDPLVTLVTDNGVDITNQLVSHGGTIPTPTVSTPAVADYQFTLNNSTGYYVSQNTGTSKSAALCKVDFNFPVRCLVTIDFINYAEQGYDFGVFGNLDVALSGDYYAAGGSGATITDTNYKLACNTATYNKSTVQTITYEVPAGEHYINIKYSKDDASNSNNDTLQWKISNIEPLEANNYYTYTLSNIQEAHSLIFIFGDVTYYFVTSNGTNAKLFPSGSMVQLPGDYYTLTIVPDDYSYNVIVTDNNVDVTSQVQRKEEEITKEGNTYTVVNYIYKLNNIQATHNITINCLPNIALYIKINNKWTKTTKVYKKISGFWVEQNDFIDLFDSDKVYITH